MRPNEAKMSAAESLFAYANLNSRVCPILMQIECYVNIQPSLYNRSLHNNSSRYYEFFGYKSVKLTIKLFQERII